MSADNLDSVEPPKWMIDLEHRLNKKKQILGHEFGAGAKCIKCQDSCPGLDLHYWRKRCLNCKCKKEDHDISEEEDSRFDILLSKEGSEHFRSIKGVLDLSITAPQNRYASKNQSSVDEQYIQPVNFDWIPADVSKEMAAEYMQQLPSNKIPVEGSAGAKYRKVQLEKQIPFHDIYPEVRHKLSKEEQQRFHKYLENIRDNVVGRGKIQRICQKQYIEESVPYTSLPQPHCSAGLVPIVEKEKIEEDSDSMIKNMNCLILEPFRSPASQYVKPSPKSSLPAHIPSVLRIPTPFKPNRPKGVSEGENSTSSHSGTGVSYTTLISPLDTISYAKHKDAPYQQGENDGFTPPKSRSPPRNYKCAEDFEFDDTQNANKPTMDNSTLLVETEVYCLHCKSQIQFGAVAIMADRAGSDHLWHPQCFVCDICQELLVDLVYFFHKGRIYCGRHYAEKLNIVRCFACDELIFVKEYTVAEGKSYHFGHFCCIQCDTKLGGKKYVLFEDQPMCLKCYETSYCKTCSYCQQTIKPDERGLKLHDMDWHATPECFKCSTCLKSLVNSQFTLHKTKRKKIVKKNSKANLHHIQVPFRSVFIEGDSHSRGLAGIVQKMVTCETMIVGFCKPGAKFLAVISDVPPSPGCCSVIIAGTNDVANGQQHNIYRHMERCITFKLQTGRVVVFTLPHRHDLCSNHLIN